MGIKNDKEIAIVVLSYDGFHELWQPFFDCFFKCWPDCPYRIYLLNNHLPFSDKRINNLLVGDDISWSDSLIKGLNLIEEKRVFFLYDDAFIYNIDLECLQKQFENCIANNYLSLMIRPSLFVSKLGNNIPPALIPQNALYRNALFCNLIERIHLLNVLQVNESAWDFELIGNLRSQQFDYFSSRKKIIHYHHGIVKGKWFYSIYIKMQNKGYIFNKLNKTHSSKESIMLKVKTIIYENYLYFLPVKIINLIEGIRKKA